MKCSRPSRTKVSGSKAQTKMVGAPNRTKVFGQNTKQWTKQKTNNKRPNRARVPGSKPKQKVSIARMRTTVFSNSEPLSLGELLQVHSHWRAMWDYTSRFFIVSVDVLLGVPDKPPKLWRRSLTLTWCQSFRTKKTSSKPNISWKWVNSRIESWLWITLGT